MTKKEKQIIGNKAKAIFEEWKRWGDYAERYRSDISKKVHFEYGQEMVAKYSFTFDILVNIMDKLGMLDEFNGFKGKY